jgi:hypothetical protein
MGRAFAAPTAGSVHASFQLGNSRLRDVLFESNKQVKKLRQLITIFLFESPRNFTCFLETNQLYRMVGGLQCEFLHNPSANILADNKRVK